MVTIEFDEYEKEIVRYLAGRYNRGMKTAKATEFPRYDELGKQRIDQIVDRFCNFGLVYWDQVERGRWDQVERSRRSSVTVLTISHKIMDRAQQLDHPKPKDYWKSVTTWFRGRWWSLPILLLLGGLPLLIQYVEMIRFLLKWMEFTE